MPQIVARMSVPNFTMEVYNHPFILQNYQLADKLIEYCKSQNLLNHEWKDYNIFKSEDPSIKKVAQQIHMEVSQFNENAFKRKDLWINGWFNILECHDSIKPHFHSAEKYSYFSGNICLGDYNTKTIFYPPWGDRTGHTIEMENKKGYGMFFPSWLWHEVPTSLEDIRYTLAFDIHTQDGMDDYWQNQHDKDPAPIQRSVKLYEIYS